MCGTCTCTCKAMQYNICIVHCSVTACGVCFMSTQHGGRALYLLRSSGLSPDNRLTDLVVLGGKGGCKWSILALVSDGEVDGGIVE